MRFPWSRAETELEHELAHHVHELTAEYQRQGNSPEEALRLAKREFGGAEQIKEECREARRLHFVEQLWRDLRYGARVLKKNPAFTAAAVVTLALSIGANTAIFSLLYAVLLQPLPFRNPDRLVMVWEEAAVIGIPQNTAAPGNLADWKKRNHVFEDMAALKGDLMTLTEDGPAEEMSVKEATANLFPLLGIKSLIGRTFLPEEDRPGADNEVLLSQGLWVRRYAADPEIVGKHIRMNDENYTVIGVLPHGFDFPDRVDVWIPLALSPGQWRDRGGHYLQVVARLRNGVTLDRAQADIGTIAKQLEQENPETNTKLGAAVIPIRQQFVGKLRLGLFVLLAAVGGVLLIACANLANLLLARGAMRQREIAVRMALGARRLRIVCQVLTETVLLSLLGAMAGGVLAQWTLGFLTKLIPLALAPTTTIRLNAPVLIFATTVALCAGILFGLAPALQISAVSVAETLKQGGRGSVHGIRGRLRNTLVVAQVSVSVMLLIGTGLMVETLRHLNQIDPGFRPEHVLCARTSLPFSTRWTELKDRVEFFQHVLARVTSIPGVISAGYTTFLPLTNRGGTSSFVIEGKPRLRPGVYNDANHRVITPDYLHTIGVPLIAGRFLKESDGPRAPAVALLNQTAARQFWPNENPLGQRFKLGNYDSQAPWITIVGVVGDVRQMGLDIAARAEIYYSYQQPAGSYGFYTPRDLAVRTAGDPLRIAAEVRRAVTETDKDQPVSQVRPMEVLLDSEIASRQIQAQLLGAFAILALVLASLGIYAVLAYGVAQRTSEIGLRLALGARELDVLRSVMVHGARLLMSGTVLGLAGAWLLTKLMRGLLYGVAPGDVGTFAASAVILLFVGLGACYFPARRATCVDPMMALRYG